MIHPRINKAVNTLACNGSTSSPDTLWHIDLLSWLAINVVHQGEAGIKALYGEQPIDKGIE